MGISNINTKKDSKFFQILNSNEFLLADEISKTYYECNGQDCWEIITKEFKFQEGRDGIFEITVLEA